MSVNPSKAEYKPGEKAAFEIAVKDRRGEGVECEISLGVIDRSVLYIQPEFAPDVRKFFYGDRRGMYGTPDSSLQHGFNNTEADSKFYPQLKTRGAP